MRKFSIIAGLALSAALAACSGGTSGVSGLVPGAAPQSISISANTASAHYLPIHSGNIWNFKYLGLPAGDIIDIGPATVKGCPPSTGWTALTGDERLDLGSGSSYRGSLFVRKAKINLQNHELTTLDATSTNMNSKHPTITRVCDTTFPLGFPFMDDTPAKGELWSDLTTKAKATIASVGGTYKLGSKTITNVASVTESFPGAQFTVYLAKGVGYTQITYSSYTVGLSAYTVNASSSVEAPSVEYPTTGGAPDFSLLKALFPPLRSQ